MKKFQVKMEKNKPWPATFISAYNYSVEIAYPYLFESPKSQNFPGFCPCTPQLDFLLTSLAQFIASLRSVYHFWSSSFFLSSHLMPANISRDRFSNSNCYLIFFKFDFPIRKWENQSFTIELETGSETFLFFNFKIVT